MDPGADPLAALRDTHMPEPTQWDALADAAMAFAAGLLVALAVVMLVRALMRRRKSRREAALAELEATRRLAGKDRLIAQANLLRRLASQMPAPSGDASALHWTARIDRETGTDFFTAGDGAALREALYRREVEIDPERIDRQLVLLLQTVKD